MAQLWSDDKIQALIQVSNDAYGTDSTLEDAMWQMRDEYEMVLSQGQRNYTEAKEYYERILAERDALGAQAARTIEHQAQTIKQLNAEVTQAWVAYGEEIGVGKNMELQLEDAKRTIEAQRLEIHRLKQSMMDLPF